MTDTPNSKLNNENEQEQEQESEQINDKKTEAVVTPAPTVAGEKRKIKEEEEGKPKESNEGGEIKPVRRRRKKRNQEGGPVATMKNELLVAARNKISFDKTKKVRKWVKQPVLFNTLGSSFEVSVWHTDEPKQLILEKIVNKSSSSAAASTKAVSTTTTPTGSVASVNTVATVTTVTTSS